MNRQVVTNLLYQLLETELGGVEIYRTALGCVQNEDLAEEWDKYMEQTERHVQIARELLEGFGLDPEADVPARALVRHMARALVQLMEKAIAQGDAATAELAACEAVVEAETKDHMNWELIGMLAKHVDGDRGRALREAYEQVEDEEDRHLYHTTGWARELWLTALGLPSVLPPPEEERDVETAIGAARAKASRGPSARLH